MAAHAVSLIESGQRVFVHGGAATPLRLLDALADRAELLRDVELIHLHIAGPPPRHADPALAQSFRDVSLFVGENLRAQVGSDRVDYLPCFLSEIPALFRSGRRPLDVALIQVSPPEHHGYCSLGTSVDVARAAVECARVVIAEVNRRMPRVHGDGFVHIDELDAFIDIDEPLPEAPPPQPSFTEERIAANVASIVENGATLQMGIGAIPDAVLRALKGHKHLGIHTEMFSDGVLDLIHSGVVDNSKKAIHPGKTISGFVLGSRALYDFVDDNPSVALLDIAYVNDPAVIARNPRVTAINSAVEVDLSGQICADSIGTRIISGVGGQMDFMRGAALSEGGRPILALPSRTKSGQPRIVPTLKMGAGVVTTRAHAHWIVTEHGVADLAGKTLHERARALIGLAHPQDRDELARAWRER